MKKIVTKKIKPTIVVESAPPRGSNFSLVNKGGGLVQIKTQLFDDPVQIGEAKRIIYFMVLSLDQAAKSWRVPNNLDEEDKPRTITKQSITI